MVRMLVIADDFTGALDTGIQFAKKGIRTQIILDCMDGLEEPDQETEVIVVDSETRHLTAKEAGRRVEEIICFAKKAGIGIIYKKTDSAMRGNIGSELTAQLAASGCNELFYIPAFPKAGRTTQNGIQYVDHIPVSESVFGRDPFEPVKYSYIPDIIAVQSGVNVKVVGKEEQKKELECHSEPIIYVFDAEKDEDLEEIAEKMKKMKVNFLAGCAGFAEFLPVLLEKEEKSVFEEEVGEGIIVISGSMNPITIRQIQEARKAGVSCITLDREKKMSRSYEESLEFQNLMVKIQSVYQNEKRVIIEAVDSSREGMLETSLNGRKADQETRQQVADNVAKVVRTLIQNGMNGVYVLIGGDTMATIMKKLGCRQIIPLKELMPGIVLSKAYHELGSMLVVSKSGGFGETDALVKLLQIDGSEGKTERGERYAVG